MWTKAKKVSVLHNTRAWIFCELTPKSGKIKPLFIKIIVIKSYYSFINRFGSFPWRINVKQVQDCSVEMTVNKPPSWVKQLFKSLPGYQA